MEDVEVSIFNPSAIEVGGGEGPSVKGGRVFTSTLAANAN